MASLINVITKFQNVALITTGGAVALWYFQGDHQKHGSLESSSDSSHAQETRKGREAHTLTGQVVDKDKQVGEK